ncbi:MAG TPA: hypothetical protein VF407_19890 [Polyangiaceae bacterium]
MTDRDPPRLSQDPATSALLRDAIREGKNDLPDDARLAAIALKLGAIGAAGGGGAGAAASAGAAKASVAPAAIKAGAVKTGMSALSFKIAAAAAVTAVAVGGVAVAPRVLGPKPAVTVAASTTIAPPTTTAPPATANDFALPPASASAAPLPVPTTPSGVASTKVNAPPPHPDDELKNVAQAKAALATDPAKALAICNDDAQTFPKGQFAEDRETVAIDALVALGRVDAARARLKKFEAQFPTSPNTKRLREKLGAP